MTERPGFFDFAAEAGLTKHLGGVQATEALIELCHINKGSYVLDVGCGVGVTPFYIAKKYGSQVIGVDICPKMIERSMERASRERVEDRIEFRVADAQDLPFEDELFDAVILVEVTAAARSDRLGGAGCRRLRGAPDTRCLERFVGAGRTVRYYRLGLPG